MFIFNFKHMKFSWLKGIKYNDIKYENYFAYGETMLDIFNVNKNN